MNEQQSVTAKFDSVWKKVEDEVETVTQNQLLPFTFKDVDGTESTLTEGDLVSQLTNIHDKKFTISVCGMVKAGKSTFLNALLFGENILPTFDTPMTAKLNFIEYTPDQNHFVANFYSQEEWNDLKGSLDPENMSQLKERIRICSERHGVDEDDFIGKSSVSEMDLSKLEEYVSDPKSKNGKYTPFVKDVHIFINNENIKDVMVVDTPGLNDPNVINSRETVKWIKNTHALIFLLPPKSIDESSLNFFDTHLLGTRPSNRIWVINKIDDIGQKDYENSVAYLRQLGRQPDFMQKNLFGREECICGYSALIAMLRSMEEKGIPLNDDQLYHLDNADGFNPDPNNLGEAVSDRLYQNTGIKRVTAGFAAIDNLYSQHLKKIAMDMEMSNSMIADGKKSEDELKKELKALQNRQQDFMSKLNGWLDDCRETVYSTVREEIYEPIDGKIKTMKRSILSRIESADSASALSVIPYAFKNECIELFGPAGALSHGLHECKRNLKDELSTICKQIKLLFVQNEIDGDVVLGDIENIANNIDVSIDAFSDDFVDAANQKLPSNFFSELFTKKSTMRNETAAVFEEVFGNLNKDFQGRVKSDIENSISSQIQNNFKTFSGNITDRIEEKKAYLEGDSSERAAKMQAAKELMEKSENKKKVIDALQREFRSKFPQEITILNA